MTKAEDNKKSNEKKVDRKPVLKPLPSRLHIDQFLIEHPEVTDVMKAGFSVYVNHKTWMREDEWKKAFKEYFNK